MRTTFVRDKETGEYEKCELAIFINGQIICLLPWGGCSFCHLTKDDIQKFKDKFDGKED